MKWYCEKCGTLLQKQVTELEECKKCHSSIMFKDEDEISFLLARDISDGHLARRLEYNNLMKAIS